MQITIDLLPDQDLLHQAERFNTPLQTLILQASQQMLQSPSVSASQAI